MVMNSFFTIFSEALSSKNVEKHKPTQPMNFVSGASTDWKLKMLVLGYTTLPWVVVYMGVDSGSEYKGTKPYHMFPFPNSKNTDPEHILTESSENVKSHAETCKRISESMRWY